MIERTKDGFMVVFSKDLTVTNSHQTVSIPCQFIKEAKDRTLNPNYSMLRNLLKNRRARIKPHFQGSKTLPEASCWLRKVIDHTKQSEDARKL